MEMKFMVLFYNKIMNFHLSTATHLTQNDFFFIFKIEKSGQIVTKRVKKIRS